MCRDLPGTWSRGLIVLALTVVACDSSDARPSGSGDSDARTAEPGDDATVLVDSGHDAALLVDAGADATVDASRDGASADAATPPDAAPPFLCTVQPPTGCPDPAPTYADVEPIFRERCVLCHSPLWTGPWPLDAYEHVSDWQSDIRSALLDCSMPPPDAGVPIPADESMQILTWLRCGLPK